MSDTATPRVDGGRRNELDALRAVAVFLMVEQHLGYWLWQRTQPRSDVSAWYIGFNALGGLAAPIFIVLAGVGAALLLASSRQRTTRALVGRGLALIAFGYALNMAAPSWFSWGSWYVLHLLGIAMMLAPTLRGARPAWLLAASITIVAATPIAQWALDTPDRLLNVRMRDMSLAGGPLRMALAEGQFPVLPWLGVYLAGMAAGKMLGEGRSLRVALLGAACVLVGLVLALVYLFGPVPLPGGLPHMALRMRLGFYPASPAIVLMLSGAALLAVWLVDLLAGRGTRAAFDLLAPLGRISLTLLVVHVPLFRELTRPVGLWRGLGPAATLATIFTFTILCVLIAHLWKRARYRYGAEWLIRKAGP